MITSDTVLSKIPLKKGQEVATLFEFSDVFVYSVLENGNDYMDRVYQIDKLTEQVNIFKPWSRDITTAKKIEIK